MYNFDEEKTFALATRDRAAPRRPFHANGGDPMWQAIVGVLGITVVILLIVGLTARIVFGPGNPK